MKPLKTAITATLALSFAACSHLQTRDYAPRAGGAEVDQEEHGAYCEMEARKFSSDFGPALQASRYNEQFDSCMRSKGFHKKAE